MNIDFQRKLDRLAGVPLCRLLTWHDRLRRPKAPAGPPAAILVILLSEMGSLVLAHPMLCRLRERFPQAALYALVFERNREVLELLGSVPPENIFTLRDEGFGRFAADLVGLRGRLRRAGIEAVIDCELFARAGSILAYLSGAALRVGFHPHTQQGLFRGDFINRPVLYNPYLHISRQFLLLAEALTSTAVPANKLPVPPPPPAPPRVTPGAGELRQMAARLAADFSGIAGRRLVLVSPGGGILPVRAWPRQNWERLCRRLVARGFAVGVIGLAADKPLAGRITAACDHPACVDMTGYTATVGELLQLFHLAELLITNDGGPGHLASLTPIASVVIFGPETPQLYRPLGERTKTVFEPTGCAPCLTAYNHRASPCDGDNRCLAQIPPERVLAEALALLEEQRQPVPKAR